MQSDSVTPVVTPVEPVPPTQVRHPWRATARTIFAAVVGFATSWGVVVDALHLNPAWQWVGVASLVAGTITRVLAIPQVDAVLNQYFPWLSSTPKVR